MQATTRRMLAATGAAAVITLLAGCGGGDENASDQTIVVPDGIGDEPETTTTTADDKAPCTVEALTEASKGDYPDTVVSRQTCASGVAVALLTGDAAGGESVAFFKDEDGSWVIITVGPIDAATAESLPDDFPDVVYTRWLSAKRQSDSGTGGGESASGGGDGGAPGVAGDPDEYTVTTIPPTTTTLPPTTEPPTTAPPVIDPYCVEFPNEPSCIENPYLPQ